VKAIRGRLLSYRPAPVHEEDGLILVSGGKITAAGPASQLIPRLPPGTPVDDHSGKLILPGFIDLHIHLPQTKVIASYGAQLMEWLERYTFVEEARYADPAVAEAGARFFLGELFRNGTTTAAVYGSVHARSAEALFAEAARRGACMIAGKVMMDRGAPEALRDTVQSSYDHSKALIERWHGQDRQLYAVTPRFAITSTPAQLEAAGALLAEHDGVYLQTHLSENQAEIELARSLYPGIDDYAGIYESFGLLGPRSLMGHCLHLSPREQTRLAESRSVAVLCPTSNLFLGSGLADRALLESSGVRTGLATDVGAGTSYSMLRTAAEAYKVEQLRGRPLPAHDAFRWITRDNAAALGLEEEIGSIEVGRHADLVVLDSAATPAMAHRMERCENLEEELFVLLTLGDDRAVAATYVRGENVLENDRCAR
jgi:guanine deaminase